MIATTVEDWVHFVMRTVGPIASITCWLFCAAALGDEPKTPDYSGQVAPIFRKYCSACHNPDEKEGGLVLDDYAALLKGGKRGGVVVAGSPDRSRLLLVLEGKAQPKMPPKDSDPPKPEEIAVLRAWVAAGAPGPAGGAADPNILITPKIDLKAKPRQPITAVAWSPDSAWVALGGHEGVRMLRMDGQKIERQLAGQHGQLNGVAFLPDGSVVGAAGEPGLFGEVAIWNSQPPIPKLPLEAPRLLKGHRDSLLAAVPSPDGKLLATSSYDEKVRLWDLARGEEVSTITGHNGAVYDVAFGRQGKLLATASGDRTVKLWDMATFQRLDTFGQPLKEVYTVAFSPDGNRVAAGGVDNRIRIWEISESAKEGSNPLLVSRFAHQAAIIKLVWSPDGNHLASSAEDGSLKIWDARTITERLVLPPQSDWAAALAFSPDSKKLAVGRMDGTWAIMDVGTGKEEPR